MYKEKWVFGLNIATVKFPRKASGVSAVWVCALNVCVTIISYFSVVQARIICPS